MTGIMLTLLAAFVLLDLVSLWVAATENIGLVGPTHNITLLPVDLAAQKQLVNRDYAKGHKPFFVGSAHWEWCLLAEADQVRTIADLLSTKRDNCFVVDVGMNDGFYTMLAASFGCHVYAFELQPLCISIAHTAARKNHFTHLIEVFHQPVGATHGETALINYPKDQYCDGGFTLLEGVYEKNTHTKNAPLEVKKKFLTVSLGDLIPRNTTIDLIKLDVEGYEPEVLLGAEPLFKSRQVQGAVVEISNHLPAQWARPNNAGATAAVPADPLAHPFFDVYQRILGYGYEMETLNCDTSPNDKGRIFRANSFDEFKTYALKPAWQKCFDVFFRKI